VRKWAHASSLTTRQSSSWNRFGEIVSLIRPSSS
jgi:hypothetical protein